MTTNPKQDCKKKSQQQDLLGKIKLKSVRIFFFDLLLLIYYMTSVNQIKSI